MANKRIKKKHTKASILQQQYSKEYNKYLARVIYHQKQGVQIQRIKRVKKPTQASIERLKKQEYQKIYSNNYFWRTWDKKEIDFVEEREGRLLGFEFKYKDKGTRAPMDWTESYPDASYEVINRENYMDFIV